jgi:hypothetical protein
MGELDVLADAGWRLVAVDGAVLVQVDDRLDGDPGGRQALRLSRRQRPDCVSRRRQF